MKQQSHFDQERGGVVPTSRSTSAQHQAVRQIEALRLVRCTQPRSTKRELPPTKTPRLTSGAADALLDADAVNRASTCMTHGLDQITFAELQSSDKMISVLREKLCTLDPSKFTDELLAARVNLLIDILRETLLDRYQALSIRAFAHIAVALDYFLVLSEEGGIPDSMPHGFTDDLKVVEQVCQKFQQEIRAFKEWKMRQPKDEIWQGS